MGINNFLVEGCKCRYLIGFFEEEGYMEIGCMSLESFYES